MDTVVLNPSFNAMNFASVYSKLFHHFKAHLTEIVYLIM